ncbi:hypothetical protein BDY24DRAFT_378242 [Mrakia frigida]|uniref:uncharacterized protein n=1 Tax=Mrakia frigida TaxID=29902 RepID=UPI003FCC0418
MTFPHRPPPPGLRRFFWRQRIWFEATFGLAMLDTWEIIMVYSILLFFTSFLLLSIYYYLPTHVSFLRRRAAYYITGDESSSLLGEAGARLLLDLFSGSKEVPGKSEL